MGFPGVTDTMTWEKLLFFPVFSRQGLSVALEPVLELAFAGQDGLELPEICLLLPPKY